MPATPKSTTVEAIHERLNGNPYVRGMTISELGGSIRLSGRTRSFYHKQMVGEAVMSVMRALNIKLQFVNEIVVD